MPNALRTTLFWIHLTCGVAAGAVVLLMSVTGVLLTYEAQMIQWAETRAYGAGDPAAEPRPMDELIRRAEAHWKDQAGGPVRATSVTVLADPRAPVAIRGEQGHRAYLDPGTGVITGSEATGMAAAMSELRAWHRWIAMEGDQRALGRGITGASNLAFLGLILTGMVLWLPRRLRWQNVRAVLVPRFRLRGQARDFNWHNTLGIWSALPLILIVVSGAMISYRWVGDLLRWAAAEPDVAVIAEAPTGPPNASGRSSGATQPTGALTTYAAIVDHLESERPGWTAMVLRPADSLGSVSVQVREGTRGQPHLTATWTGAMNASAKAGAWATFQERDRPGRVRSFMRFAHTGEFWGWVGQTVAGLVTLFTVILVWTGIAMALRRLRRFLRRRSRLEDQATG